MDIRDYVYYNRTGNCVFDSNGFCKDLIGELLCSNLFQKEHIELIEKILGCEK